MPAIHRHIESGKNETQDKNEITKIERKMRETDAPKNMTNSKKKTEEGKACLLRNRGDKRQRYGTMRIPGGDPTGKIKTETRKQIDTEGTTKGKK